MLFARVKRMTELLPLFLNLSGRRVLLVGGGTVAGSKLAQLRAAGADVLVVAPVVSFDTLGVLGPHEAGGVGRVEIATRPFVETDLDDVWLVVAAATPEVNRAVSRAANARRIFVNAVDDPPNATAYLGGVLRRDGVTLAISSDGHAPALTGLLREALDAALPADLDQWMQVATRLRPAWKQDAVPMAARRPLLLQALNALYADRESTHQVSTPSGAVDRPRASGSLGSARDAAVPPSGGARSTSGRVSLVGGGPGDPALLTRRAVSRLRGADLVLYDALVDQRVLHIARRAQRFFVGKRAGRPALAQREIHAIMIRAAKRGRRVVRLKGGDPFVFGRGGEEALALSAAGVPFDVVPGVSSVLAAPAVAGIPVTHRGVSSSLVVTTGHDVEAFGQAVAGMRPDGLTLVIVMGYARRAELSRRLRDAGWPASTPAAIVTNATMPTSQTWRGSLAGLADAEGLAGAPALIVVGRVAALALTSASQPAVGGTSVKHAGRVRRSAGPNMT